MNVYVINLRSAKERRKKISGRLNRLGIKFTIVEAVNGAQFTAEDIAGFADMQEVADKPHWLTKGAIACALSHIKVYETMVADGVPHALVLEDDAEPDKNLKRFLDEYDTRGSRFDVCLLYSVSWTKCLLQREGHEAFTDTGLYAPQDVRKPITASAYIIKTETGARMASMLKPIRAAADSWGDFCAMGAVQSLGCAFPMLADVRDEKSTIDYVSGKHSEIFRFIDKYKVFPLKQILKWRRKMSRKKMLNVSLE